MLACVALGCAKLMAEPAEVTMPEGEEQVMSFVSEQGVGGRIQLTIQAGDDLDIVGVMEMPETGTHYYTITEPEVLVYGTVTEFSAIYSSITTVDVTKMPTLETLDLFGNPITTIDLSNNANLIQLLIGGSKVETLDLKGCPKLQYLNINSAAVSSMDLTNSGELITVLARASKMKNWDLTGATALEVLDCSFVGLESINLERATRLNQLACAGNNMQALDVAKCPNLLVLNCNKNNLTRLDLTKLPLLEELGCSNNLITELDMSKCPNLFGLILNSNDICHKKMAVLANSLPTVKGNPGYLVVVDQKDKNEKNVCSQSTVAVMEGKNWAVLDYDGGSNFDGPGIPYEGCPDDQVSVMMDSMPEFVVYPTVASDCVYVEGLSEGAKIELVNMQGAVVLSAGSNGAATRVETAALERGVYVLTAHGQSVRVVLK